MLNYCLIFRKIEILPEEKMIVIMFGSSLTKPNKILNFNGMMKNGVNSQQPLIT
jgi:hypothetical protein